LTLSLFSSILHPCIHLIFGSDHDFDRALFKDHVRRTVVLREEERTIHVNSFIYFILDVFVMNKFIQKQSSFVL